MFDRKLSQDRLLIGIGGNMGAGKTTVANELVRYGAKVIDADELGWSILNKGTPEYRAVVRTFGRSILTKSGRIDRRALADVAFASRTNLNKLNRIVHPTLIARVRREIDRHKKGLVVVDAALLFYWGLDKEMDVSILVTAPERLKVERMTQIGMSAEQVKARLRLQQPDLSVWRRADFVFENKGSMAELRRKTRALWNFFYSARFQSFKASRGT
ncbi:MAG: dephospho-CoA kinase [candidate division WOR-3 bacterium]